MDIGRFLATTHYTARFGVKLCLGFSLLSGVPAMAQTIGPTPILMAQSFSLSEGSQGPAVEELQRQLDRRGLFPQAITGFYGSATTQAVRQFQRIRRLEVTGIADPQTLNLLGIDISRLPAGFAHPVHGAISGEQITPRSSADDVRVLQRVLRSYGFNLAVDGVYGGGTAQAVRAYQRTADLPVDGIADRATLINMGFESGTIGTNPNFRTNGRTAQGRYVAAVIAGPSELNRVRQSFPNATVESNRTGEYISLGRFSERSDAAIRVDYARDLGYEAQILWD